MSRMAGVWRLSSYAALVVLGAALLGACSTAHFENTPLQGAEPNAERRVVDQTNPARPLVLVAISGGGSRAAALGWAVLSELNRAPYKVDGLPPHTLAQDVAVISSVSGGSVIAADFALTGPAGLADFKTQFLDPNLTEELVWQILNPFHLLSAAVSGTSRTERAAAMFDQRVFHGKTFKDINQSEGNHPYLVLNATDLGTGDVFSFTPDDFDAICSSLDDMSIAKAVAASSAVPVALAPIALEDFAVPVGDKGCKAPAARQWPAYELTNGSSQYTDLATYKHARYLNELRHGQYSGGGRSAPPYRDLRYVYLVDGGVADNLGIHGLMRAWTQASGPAILAMPDTGGTHVRQSILSAINRGGVQRIVVVVINAKSEGTPKLSQSRELPGVIDMIEGVVNIPIDAATGDTASQITDLVDQLRSAGGAAQQIQAAEAQAAPRSGSPTAPLFGALKVDDVVVDFDLITTDNALRDKVKAISTSWNLGQDQLCALELAGRELVRQNPNFQKMAKDLGIPASDDSDLGALRRCAKLD